MSTLLPSDSPRPLVTRGIALARPLVPVSIPTPAAPFHLIHVSRVKAETPRFGAGPMVTDWLVPLSWSGYAFWVLRVSVVQARPSLHSAAVVQLGTQVPDPGSHACPAGHVLTCWQPSSGSQLSVVQANPSSEPTAAWRQPSSASQVSVVHRLLSSQFRGVPGWQMPPL